MVDELPEALAITLRLVESGEPARVVAAALDVPEQSVSVLLRVARAKLAHMQECCARTGAEAGVS